MITLRVLWKASDEEDQAVKNCISFGRHYCAIKLAKLTGMHFVLTCITGTKTNPKKKKSKNDEDQIPKVRPGFTVICCFVETPVLTTTIIEGILSNSGMDPTVAAISTRKSEDDPLKLASEVTSALKDNNSTYAHVLVEESIAYISDITPHLKERLCKTPASMIISNPAIKDLIMKGLNRLNEDGFVVTVTNTSEELSDSNVPCSGGEKMKGLERALFLVTHWMQRNHYALHKGLIFTKVPEAILTFDKYLSVDNFINECLGNVFLRGIIVPFVDQIVKRLGHPNCGYIKQIKIQWDLIEVEDGYAWSISAMKFVPLNKEFFGKITPRKYVKLNRNRPVDAKYFAEMLQNSFPDVENRILFLVKWYQLLGPPMPFKLKKLLVFGEPDCGKSTIVKPVLQFIPMENMASFTKEKAFSTSLLKPETLLTHVDEFSEEYVSADQAKQVLQGGIYTNSTKHKTASMFRNISHFYFTSNHEPDWGQVENPKVKLRLAIFQMVPLPHVDRSIAFEIENRSLDAVIYVALELLRHWDLVPREECYFRNPAPLEPEFQKMQREKICQNMVPYYTGHLDVAELCHPTKFYSDSISITTDITSTDEQATIGETMDAEDKVDINSIDEQQTVRETMNADYKIDKNNVIDHIRSTKPIKQIKKAFQSKSLQFFDLDCMTDVIDLRRNPKDASEDEDDQIDFSTNRRKQQSNEDSREINYARNIKSLLKGNLGCHPDVVVGHDHYSQYLLRRDRVHKEALQNYVHNQHANTAEKEALFAKLKGKI